MHPRLNALVETIRRLFARRPRAADDDVARPPVGRAVARTLGAAKRPLLVVAAVGATAWLLVSHPPVGSVGRGEVGVRINQLTGARRASGARAASWSCPGLHGCASSRCATSVSAAAR